MSAEEDANPHHDPEWLREKYTEQGISQEEMAELAGVTQGAIRHHLHKHDIEKKQTTEAEIAHDLRDVASEMGKIPTAKEYFERGEYSRHRVYDVFGSYNTALDDAFVAGL